MHDVIEAISAPEERLAEGDAPDTSGVLQPVGTEDRHHADMQEVIEDISWSAMADNGALQQGDSPDAGEHLGRTDPDGKDGTSLPSEAL